MNYIIFNCYARLVFVFPLHFTMPLNIPVDVVSVFDIIILFVYYELFSF
jgi:hypothetical protein